ncbi:MAG: hypothetical protein M3065_13395 [Actinomycetota bacterium]|nr:hypothetical protein [Actinomycetota bacterium]
MASSNAPAGRTHQVDHAWATTPVTFGARPNDVGVLSASAWHPPIKCRSG